VTTLSGQCGQKLKRKVSASAALRKDAPAVARFTDPPADKSTTIQCFKCEHKQRVSESVGAFACEKCGQMLKRRASVAAVPERGAPAVARSAATPADKCTTVQCFKCEHRNTVTGSVRTFACEKCGQTLKRRMSIADLPPHSAG